MAAKTATAPAPVRGSKVGVKIAVACAVFIVGYVWGLNEGWWGGGPPGEEEPSEQERVLVTWQVWWLRVIDTGEVYEDTGKPRLITRCEDREINITTFVDGEPTPHDKGSSDADPETEPCIWRWSQAVPEGSELRLLVEEVAGGGWKMCQIDVDSHLVLPSGWAVATDGADCDAWGLAL